LAEFGLLALALVHVATGLVLVYQNYMARPDRYAVNARAGGRTIGSATMPYTGVLILMFVIFHLANFHFVDKSNTTIFDIVRGAFSSPAYVGIYTAAMVVVGLHVSHGFWSLFQSLGLNHPKYMPLITAGGLVFAVVVALGFGLLPIYVAMLA
jgi:succinate dehydrogenase / fumarate reductase cytochrome b subunit